VNATRRAAPVLAALIAAACLGRVETPDDADSAALTAGWMRLAEFPVESAGVSGLSPSCRVVFECGCPLLYPDDVAFCRELVWTYGEDDCAALLAGVLPECPPP
jgi:hypothetical protein